MKPNGEVCMTTGIKFAGIVLVLATACSAQEGLNVQSKGKQKWPAAEAQKIYLSACSVVQREFGVIVASHPKSRLYSAQRRMRLSLREERSD